MWQREEEGRVTDVREVGQREEQGDSRRGGD